MTSRKDYLSDVLKQIKEHLDVDASDFDSKDVYLRKNNDLIGLHAVGCSTETGWQQFEGWCNAYSNDGKFLASIYRIFGSIEDEAAQLKAEGWIEVQKPT